MHNSKKLGTAGAMLAFILLAHAADSIKLNVKPGLWEFSSAGQANGMPPIPDEALARLTPEQRARCLPYLREELVALDRARVIVTLGKIADDTVHGVVKERGRYVTSRAPFAHLAETRIELPPAGPMTIVASYHPSRQNTNTGVLTEPMLDAVFERAHALLGD